MISRVTAASMSQSAMRQLQSNLSELSRLQEQATSQRAFRAASDDPTAASKTLQLHAQQRRTEQYARNIDDGMAWVTTVDSAIGSSVSLLARVRDLTLQGANSGALDDTAREAIAVELEGLRDELMAQANTTLLGRSVFAATSDAPAAFAQDYSFTGVPGVAVERRVSENSTVQVDADGSAVFGTGADSVFALVDSVVAGLRSGGDVQQYINGIDARRVAMLGVQGAVGARQSQLERAQEATVNGAVSLEAQRASVEDVDSVEILVRLQSQELVYQSALAVTARVLQPSLMEFLR